MRSHHLLLLATLLPHPACVSGASSQSDDDDTFGGWGDDDTSADDDDTQADDDDTQADDDDTVNLPQYPEEELWFALSTGDTWRYDEVSSGQPEPTVDDIRVTVLGKLAASDLDPAWPPAMVAYEVLIDRLFGADWTHYYGLNGTGAMFWLHSQEDQVFEQIEHPGDGGLVFKRAPDEQSLLGETYEHAWHLPDLEGLSLDVSSDSIETLFYGDNKEVETLGNALRMDGGVVGLQYLRGGWGLLGQSLQVEGDLVEWTIIECSPCPAEAGL